MIVTISRRQPLTDRRLFPRNHCPDSPTWCCAPLAMEVSDPFIRRIAKSETPLKLKFFFFFFFFFFFYFAKMEAGGAPATASST